MSAWSALCITLFSDLLFLLSCVIHLTSSSHFHHHGSDVHLSSKFRTLDLTSRENDIQMKMCPPDHYVDKIERMCKPCSVCPMNQIIRRPCGAGEDTRCGPFVEFERFQQKTRTKQAPHVAKLWPRQEQPRKHHRHHENHHNKGKEKVTSTVTSLAVVTEAECQPWRILSIILIIVLCCVCCCLVACILYTCRLHSLHTQVAREPDPLLPYHSMDPEPRYVDPFLFNFPRHCPATSRHFPVYQNISTQSDVTVPLTSCDVHKMARPDSACGQLDQYVYLNRQSSSACFV